MNLAEFWPQCLTLLSAELSEQQFQSAIAPLTVGEENGVWVVYAKNQFATNLIRSQYANKIYAARVMIAPDAPEIVFKAGMGQHYSAIDVSGSLIRSDIPDERLPEMTELKQDLSSKTPKNSAQDILAARLNNLRPARAEQSLSVSETTKSEPPLTAIESARLQDEQSKRFEQTGLTEEQTFETLVVGKGNQLPVMVARTIAEKPGDATYNPFFVYGSTGLGKTHLVQAIANELLHLNPKARVRYIHSDEYLKNLMNTVRNKTWDIFKQQYLNYDLLIIDDIQFIAGKERTMEEFFFLFEHFYQRKQQIILTCDKLPTKLEDMEERLISRFSWGMTLPIEPPETEMRVAILERKAQSAGIDLDDDAALLIAQNVKQSVRELEGAFNRVKAKCMFEKHSRITKELVEITLSDIIASNYKPITVELIMKTVADRYHISIRDILGKKRSRNIARPRQMAMTLTKELTNLSLPAIGDAFGGRDHTTVMHAIKTITELCESEAEWQRDYNELLILIRH
ncbi:MAG: chromosomal replication initiator protein DnaA [Alysiella sp.]|uniref:chromosomal replication initiator protein DnaA n=1 Tax=Alysiella sp. TaxID=1872483 RepID=UPI0026DBB1DE|nr:chromosomal replication initiator protein DnaA [Alysiella sp.]MDO4432966.1 chromosomal replication initiator protein DnaA [Alysiella sp.]